MARTRRSQLNWETLARTQTHPLKLQIVELYATGEELTPIDVQRELGEKLGNVSYHVRGLVDAGLLELVRTEQRRGALAHVYRASALLVS